MSEKRFEVLFYGDVINCVRDENGKEYNLHELISILMEQQATIRKLQDICGESDSENAKLRIENKKLKEENEQLREINKELGDDLYNCRLNKNIIREKLKLWQDVHKEYGIYSIKDFEESFELDAKINKEKGI